MRRVRKKGTNKEKVFGCDLLEHLNASSQEVPHVLRSCSEFVETHGVVDGIYRLSGVSSNIQKLRADFESEGTPDLNKDVYLQDIHSVSSLCKAYFRELPNPLLTYQLYDKFADAVAIQLEEERLLKIRHVLKELPSLHYRTLEYLMHHLLRMASYSSETNMHARNLAIVWAPNLLRSKDIEASGFNGTAVFKEVRVQSIVVEFILTHVPQLFPEQGISHQRRTSLPFPSTESNQDEDSIKFRHTQPVLTFGNICPGDAPLPIRPYHAIIEGSEKRKGSLKGRKWMSIFNIGSRFHDPLRRQKHSVKEKDRNALRPARSMDSLSTPSYPNEGSRGTSQHPSNKSPPLMTPSSHSGLDTFAGAIGRSEYAVTYRRGTGAVSAGNQGTSAALDLEGVKSPNHESVQSKSPGDSAKMSRRAAMHITGPTLVTVPLHITTNLAFGVLQRGGGDKIIHYSRDKDGKDKITDKEKGDEVEIKDEEGDKNDKEILMERTEDKVACGGIEIERDGMKEKQHEDCGHKPEMMMADVFREMRPKILSSDFEEASVVTHEMDHDEDSEYMDNLNSTEDDLTLSGYVQDNFEFLDHMDCSVLEHMECTVPYQVHEFSVEPPGHSDDEYEVMEQGQPSHHVDELQRHTESKSPKQLSIDANGRHIKSLSLPYMTSPIHGQEESGSDDDDDDNDVDDYNSEDEENITVARKINSIMEDPRSSNNNNEQPLNPEESTYWCSMYPLSTDGESSVMADTTPQHCRITALNLRQQQQQEQHRDRLDSDIGKEAMMKAVMQQDDICEGEHEKDRDNGGREKEKPKLSGGEREGGKDVSRNSPLSMYFDEAVAIATMRREKEKECEKERQREWGNEMQ
ncbi:Rho GTPase-activating protein 30 [Takifugu flavidus]|uniref:Rho GTPase-activating protein 30 n=1 Tax=Takifugu flavidus TaxID=433684 RepID=A0A5C6P382_9TELE|nr:Rho GTPase-activating protein 30 [Takifugu flavidus]